MVLACSANTQLSLLALAVGACRSQVKWKGMKEKDTDAQCFPDKAVMSHSMCTERAEQSGSSELQFRVGSDTRIRDIGSWRLWRVHHAPVIP